MEQTVTDIPRGKNENQKNRNPKLLKLHVDGCEVTLVFSDEPNCEIAELVKNVLLDAYFQNNRAP